MELQDGGNVATPIAVVWRRPDGHELVVKHVLDALVHQLVCAADQLQVVQVHELLWRREGREGREGGREGVEMEGGKMEVGKD